MNGIMSGITDREDYQDGSTAERLIAAAGEPGGIDPLSQFLIQGDRILQQALQQEVLYKI